MDIQIGETWQSLDEQLIPSIRADVVLRILRAIRTKTVPGLTAWVTATEPEVYQRARFADSTDADTLITANTIQEFQSLTDIANISLAMLADLVYAAAAVDALNPARVLVDEVYELSVFGEVAQTTRLTIPLPALAPGVRFEVKSAYIDIDGATQTVEFRPQVRQRKFEDTWAELELPSRRRLWFLATSAQLTAKINQTGEIAMFPKVGSEFLESPILVLKPDQAIVSVPPISTLATDHTFYTFPEIQGELFMFRVGVPPKEIITAAGFPIPADPNWPNTHSFHAESGDILLYGPSHPRDVEVWFPASNEPDWVYNGDVTEPDRSRDLADKLQQALDRMADEADTEDITAPPAFVLSATSKAQGTLHLGIEAEVDAVVSQFPDGKRAREVTFTKSELIRDVPLQIPGDGEPVETGLELAGSLSRSVIRVELAVTDAPSGDDKIGVRLIEGVSYTQPFDAHEAFELSAFDIRLAQATAGATLDIEFSSDDAVSTASAPLSASGPVADWLQVRLDTPLAVEPDTTYQVRVSVRAGSVVWLCGAGGERKHLLRHEGVGPATQVVDVADGAPLLGQMRLRSDVILDKPAFELTLIPGDLPVSLRDVQFLDDGGFQGRVDLLPGLKELAGTEATLRMQARAEGSVTLTNPVIRYQLTFEQSD